MGLDASLYGPLLCWFGAHNEAVWGGDGEAQWLEHNKERDTSVLESSSRPPSSDLKPPARPFLFKFHYLPTPPPAIHTWALGNIPGINYSIVNSRVLDKRKKIHQFCTKWKIWKKNYIRGETPTGTSINNPGLEFGVRSWARKMKK